MRLLIIILVWSFLVIPSLIAKIDLKKHPLSDVVKYSKLGRIYNLGLIICPILVTLYLFQFATNILSSISISILIVACIACIFGGLITMNRSIRIHTLIAQLCFSLYGIGFLLLSISLGINSILLTVVGLSGMYYFAKIKRWSGIAEIWGFLFFTLWIFLI